MKVIMRMVLTIALLIAGAAAGFVEGRNSGFAAGSEWSLMQAELFAREEGVFMPVRYENGKFLVMMKQPHQGNRLAWERADREEEKMMRRHQETGSLSETIRLARNIVPTE